MGILITVLTVFDVLIALLIIGLVLVQQSSSGGGLGTTFGGGGNDSLFGAHASSHLTKITVVCAAIFICLTLALAIMAAHRHNESKYSNLNSLLTQSSKPAVTEPVKAVEAPAKAVTAPVDVHAVLPVNNSVKAKTVESTTEKTAK